MNRNIKLVTQIIVCVTRFYSQPLYHFTSFLTTAADPSLPLRMTPYRPSSLRTGAEKESSFYSFASFPQASILRPASPATSL